MTITAKSCADFLRKYAMAQLKDAATTEMIYIDFQRIGLAS